MIDTRPPLRPLGPAYYRRPAVELARALLGKMLLCRAPRGLVGGWITEVEAYVGEEDPACHAAAGRTDRNAVMYGTSGHAYVYFTYGMHHCFNVVAGKAGSPEAVLIRALEPCHGLLIMRRRRGGRVGDRDLARGPARLCQALGLDLSDNGRKLRSPDLFLAHSRPAPRILGVSARVGIRKGVDRPWRFYDAESRFVSPGRPGPPGKLAAGREGAKRRSGATLASRRPR